MTTNKTETAAERAERLALAVQREAQSRSELRAKLEAKYELACLSEKTRDLIFERAWEEGHAEGEQQIEYHYEDFAEIALAAYSSGVAAATEIAAMLVIDAGGREGQAKDDYLAGHKDGREKTYGASAGDTITTDYLAGFREGAV